MKLNIKYLAVAMLSMMAALPLSANAQKEKSFTPPKAGDYSFGIDAMPVVNFVGNIFNGTMDQEFDYIGGDPTDANDYTNALNKPTISITGRYMLSSSIAIRANVGLLSEKDYKTAYATDDLALANNPLSEAKVVDSRTIVESGVSLAVGMEYRVGRGRIQGVFSGNALYAYSKASASFAYGNAITSLNQDPSNGSLNGGVPTPGASYMSTLRPLDVKNGATNTIGLMGTAGVEWFVASNISLGLEVNLVAACAFTAQAYGEYEGYNLNAMEVEGYTYIVTPASRHSFIGTGNYGSNLTLNFYF